MKSPNDRPSSVDASSQTVSVVVPVYNSALTVEPLVARLTTVLDACATAWEIIFVDDGSADTSWETISQIAATGNRYRGLRLMRNYGQHNALLAGIREA